MFIMKWACGYYRRNKQVMNDAVPSVPKDENSFDVVAITKRKTDTYTE